eukprot:8799207-Heterocapsa_arctica.AAC.1
MDDIKRPSSWRSGAKAWRRHRSPVKLESERGDHLAQVLREEEQDRAYLEKAENQNISGRATRSGRRSCGCGA